MLQFNVNHQCRWHRWQMIKIFNQKNFNYFDWTPFVEELTYIYIFAFKFTFRCLQPDIDPMPTVSLTPVTICHRRRCHRWQICRRYCWHWWQICHRCQQHKWNWWKNLLPVSLTPVVHLDLRISPQIFDKIWNDPNVIFRGFMKKTLSKNSRDTVPLIPSPLFLLSSFSTFLLSFLFWPTCPFPFQVLIPYDFHSALSQCSSTTYTAPLTLFPLTTLLISTYSFIFILFSPPKPFNIRILFKNNTPDLNPLTIGWTTKYLNK